MSVAETPDDWIEIISTNFRDSVSVHHGHMPEIEITGERTATGIWAMSDVIDHLNGHTVQGFGHYHETYEKGSDDHWRIKSLVLSRLRVDDLIRRDLA